MVSAGKKKTKIDLQGIIDSMINEIIAIDSDGEMSRSAKTKAITRLATHVKNQLHDDKRKKDDNKIAPSTYRKYMTQVRRAVTEKNWVHHSLEQQVSTLSKRYPQYADEFQKMLGMGIEPLRKHWKKLLNAAEKAGNNDAHGGIRGMKLDHEIMRHLTMASATKASLESEQREASYSKVSQQVTVAYDWLINTIYELLTKKSRVVGSESVFSYSQLALGLGLATGRRQIEILYQGEIELVSENQVKFIGQAKKRGGADYADENIIYTLVDAKLVVDAWQQLRELPEMKDLAKYDELSEVARNEAINGRCSSTINGLTKRVLGGKQWVFKDSRDLWARVVHDLHYSEWRQKTKKSEDLFWQEMLGHESAKTQIGYKKFHVVYEVEEDTNPSKPVVSRLKAVKQLDEHQEIKERQALQKIHAWVLSELEKDEQSIITQSRITREVGSSRGAIKDYLAIAEKALSGEANEPAAGAPKITTAEVTKPKQKPHFKAVSFNGDKWEVSLKIGEKTHHWKGRAKDRTDAMTKAYNRFVESDLIK